MCFKLWLRRNRHLTYRACFDSMPKHKPLYLVSCYFIIISKCWSYPSEKKKKKKKKAWEYLDNSTKGIIIHWDMMIVYYWKKNGLPNPRTFVRKLKNWDKHNIFVLKYIVLWWSSSSLDSSMLNNPV